MHIVLGILGAIVTILILLKRLADAGHRPGCSESGALAPGALTQVGL